MGRHAWIREPYERSAAGVYLPDGCGAGGGEAGRQREGPGARARSMRGSGPAERESGRGAGGAGVCDDLCVAGMGGGEGWGKAA